MLTRRRYLETTRAENHARFGRLLLLNFTKATVFCYLFLSEKLSEDLRRNRQQDDPCDIGFGEQLFTVLQF